MNPRKIITYVVAGAVVFVVAGFYVDQQMKKLNVSIIPEESGTPSAEKIDFKNYGKAPDFQGISNWLNSNPLTIASLRGKVVLIDFWTYSCINCIRTLPYVTKWYDTYKDQGLVVVGVHTPEFAFEKDPGNVADAIKHFGIHYPVAQDNNYATWNAYSNQYWPAEYLVDKNGDIVYIHFGEGNYDHTENAIRTLLGLNMAEATPIPNYLSEVSSPEMYFGTSRLRYLTSSQNPSTTGTNYIFPKDLSLNNFALEGNWQFTNQSVKLIGNQGKIRLKFHAGKIHIVASSLVQAKLTILVDGKARPSVTVQESELYTLFDSNDYSDHVIEIQIDQPGFEAFTFTFG